MVTRIAAGLVALAAMIGLAAYWVEAWEKLTHDPLLILWVSAAYFTDLSNLLVAATFATFAVRGSTPATQRSLGLAVTIMLVLVTGYFGVLGGAEGFGTRGLADTMTHGVTPALAILVWLALLPKAELRWRDALIWPLPVAGYFAYAMVRGGVSGDYPYPFLDPEANGPVLVAAFAAAFVIAALVFGLLVVALARRTARKTD